MNSFEHVSRWTRLGLAVALVCAPAARVRAQSEAIKNQSNEFVGEGYGTPSGGQTAVDATAIASKAKASGLKAGKSSGAKPSETTAPTGNSSDGKRMVLIDVGAYNKKIEKSTRMGFWIGGGVGAVPAVALIVVGIHEGGATTGALAMLGGGALTLGVFIGLGVCWGASLAYEMAEKKAWEKIASQSPEQK